MMEHWKLPSNDLFNDKGIMKAIHSSVITARRWGDGTATISAGEQQLRAADLTVRILRSVEGE